MPAHAHAQLTYHERKRKKAKIAQSPTIVRVRESLVYLDASDSVLKRHPAMIIPQASGLRPLARPLENGEMGK